jgi:hypothetical protein
VLGLADAASCERQENERNTTHVPESSRWQADGRP